ncbi:hypothetical protein DC094_19740 [Pelagibaculum spongiae]|uniref:Uncharacterized protein n=2 Tax=Pelagibaculum spongiae TaxID=2080658 RepID=A0A2V1GXG8_9GAMM|nr:STY4851/ECs_5259 family protein [Pelagibaculum spongiae]PVZ64545.1 hypothetical protein DC094_19740 [Pelagibaculum spongiae]
MREFLKQRSLEKPDRRGLYAYHCQSLEYIRLREILHGFSPSEQSLNDATCGCFVIYCAEWFRREYRSEYGWQWEKIHQSLETDLSASERPEVMERGFNFWLRPLHTYTDERRDFIGSVFSEGGLPFQLLREDGSRFQSLFNNLLKKHQLQQFTGSRTADLVEDQLRKYSFPKVFTEPASISLIADMVDQLIVLVTDYALDEHSEPVKRLDSVHARWREEFPLPLDEQTGKEFLNGLLTQATCEQKLNRSRRDELSCTHFWSKNNPHHLIVNISLPKKLEFSLQIQPSTTYFDLTLVEDGQAIGDLGAVFARINNQVAELTIKRRMFSCKRKNCTASLKLVATAGGVVIAEKMISNSSVALGEEPLGFEPDQQQWRLAGQASFSSASTDLLLMLPENTQVKLADQQTTQLTECPSVLGCLLYRLQGKAQLHITNHEHYCIQSGAVSLAQLGLDLVYADLPLNWSCKPALSFIGLPKVQWPRGAGGLEQEAELFISGKSHQQVPLIEHYGVHWLSVRNQTGNTLLRRKIGILPADFKVELISGQPGEGSILVHSQHRCLLQLPDCSSIITSKQVKHSGYTELQLSAKALPPSIITLQVTPNLQELPICIELPFPGSGCVGFDAKGQRLKPDLCIDELLGSRLYLYGQPGRITGYDVELGLKGSHSRQSHYHWRYQADDKPVEISLYAIRDQIADILSLNSGLDQVAELRIFSAGKEQLYRIRRYAMTLEYDAEYQQVSFGVMHDQKAETHRLQLMLLHDPLRAEALLTSQSSQGVATGLYDLPNCIEKDGPWLVLPQKDSSVAFRPRFIPGNPIAVNFGEDIKTLHKASRAFRHGEFVSSFDGVFDQMAMNPEHSGWQFLRDLLNHYGYLPLATFEVWKSFIHHQPVLAMALFKFEMKTSFLVRLEADFPFFWEFFPITEIQSAARYFCDWMMKKGLDQARAQMIVNKRFSALGSYFSSYGASIEKHLTTQSQDQEMNFPKPIFEQVVLSAWHMTLIRQRSEAKWPEYAATSLQRWYLQYAQKLVRFPSINDHQRSVIYLPVFAAAVTCGQARVSDVFINDADAVFFMRQVRDFDREWFDSLYQYCVINYLKNA